MTIVRSEVSCSGVGDIPADFSVNTVYHNVTANLAVGDVGWQSHSDEVLAAFDGSSPDDGAFTTYARRLITVKCYDMADPKPRPVHAMSTNGIAADNNFELGPRQVALCLSYFAGRNLPGLRGHIYIGPFLAASITAIPSDGLKAQLIALGKGLFNVGGGNVHWQQHSEKTGVTSTITDIWVDNRWDTQRRRLAKATNRSTFTF